MDSIGWISSINLWQLFVLQSHQIEMFRRTIRFDIPTPEDLERLIHMDIGGGLAEWGITLIPPNMANTLLLHLKMKPVI